MGFLNLKIPTSDKNFRSIRAQALNSTSYNGGYDQKNIVGMGIMSGHPWFTSSSKSHKLQITHRSFI